MSFQRLWEQRSRAPDPVTVSELYRRVEDFLQDLKARPAECQELETQSKACSLAVQPLVDRLDKDLPTPRVQSSTLEALALGMVKGACDGALLYQYHVRPVPIQVLLSSTELNDAAEILRKNILGIVHTADTAWRTTHPDDLHLLCAYGKQTNLKSLEEATSLAADNGTDFFLFQKFLLASVKGGYAMGMAQAAVTYLG